MMVVIHSVPLTPALLVAHADSQRLPVICLLVITWQGSCLLLIVAHFVHIFMGSAHCLVTRQIPITGVKM